VTDGRFFPDTEHAVEILVDGSGGEWRAPCDAPPPPAEDVQPAFERAGLDFTGV